MNKTILKLFAENVKKNPNHIAIYTEQRAITYGEFFQEVNQCASHLRKLGVKSNTIVGLAMERSYEMMVAIFAIITAGGAYLPIEISLPLARKQQMVSHSQLQFLLIHHEKEGWDIPKQSQIILYDDMRKKQPQKMSDLHQPEDLAYVIYTSGSTGMPKGVLIQHKSLENRITWMQDVFPLSPKDVIFQKTCFYFDVSVWEILWWSAAGASVVLLPQNREHDVILFVKMIEKYKISVIHFVPSVLKIFLDYIETDFDLNRLRSLHYVFSSGEALDSVTVNRFNQLFKNEKAVLVNLYGPTEATIDVSYFIFDKDTEYHEIPIGSAIYQTTLYVLDEQLNPVSDNTMGELYIGGIGVAAGYLNNAELTQQAFIAHPFISGERLYKTGDLVKWNSNNQLIYIGRIDHQIKLRGIRIEIGDIQHHLKLCPIVKDAHIVFSKKDEASMLVAFVILNKISEQSAPTQYIENFLMQCLPAYMVPSKIFFLEKFPIKKNGKIDTDALISCLID